VAADDLDRPDRLVSYVQVDPVRAPVTGRRGRLLGTPARVMAEEAA
jgi:hypothetical protein